MNILYVHKFLNQNLPVDTLNTLSIDKVSHSLGTRGSTKGLLKCQNVNTTSFGMNSLSRIASCQWNQFQLHFPNLNLTEVLLSKLKSITTKVLISTYNDR